MLSVQIEANDVIKYMDLRHKVLSSPAITCENRLNACQSSTAITSSIASPANTSVHATASIRCIKPNIVKSRAKAFEGMDADVTKMSVPAKTVIGGNSYAKTGASPSPVNVTVANRHSVLQQSKSANYGQISGIKPREKTAQCIFDMDKSPACQSPPSPVCHSFHPMQSVAATEVGSSQITSYVVAQRLKLYENKPVMSNKPALLPKPRSPHPDSVANRASVYRSRSSDPVMQSDVCCISSQDAAQMMTNESVEIPAGDADMRTKCAARQVKDVINPPSSSSETSNIVSPKRPQTSQESVVVGRPPSFSRKVKEMVIVNSTPLPSGSESETNKVVFQQAPKKPPRMTVAGPHSVTPTHDDSYGLLVYAAGAASPSCLLYTSDAADE